MLQIGVSVASPTTVIDPNVLDVAMCYKEDMLVLGNDRNNENFRHAAYRHGLGY